MSITDNYVPVKTLGNGVTAAFSGNWPILAAGYERVYWEDVTTHLQTLKVVGTDYDLVFDDSGFTVTFKAGHIPPATVYVVIGRDVPLDQTDPYKTSTGFNGKVVENSYDKLTAIAQDQADQIARAPKLQLGSTLDLNIPPPVNGHWMIWNPTADDFIDSGISITDITTGFAGLNAAIIAAQASATNASIAAGAASSSASDANTAATTATNAANAAIAAVGGVKITGADTTPAVLNTKLLVGREITKATGNPGANETLTIDVRSNQATTLTPASGTATINISNGIWFKVAPTGNFTLAVTFDANKVQSLIVEAVNWGLYTISKPTIKWPGGTVPTFSTAGTDIFVLFTDANNVLYGQMISKGAA